MKKTNTTTTEKRLDANLISAETLQKMASAITIKALKTTYAKSGDKMIRTMLYDAIGFSKNPLTAKGGDGAELVQDTALYLSRYIGKYLTDSTADGQTDKDGNEIDILRGAFRNIRKVVYSHEKRQYKQVYLTDYTAENGEIAVPFLWDIDNTADYMETESIIKSLELTKNQYQILNKRLKGYSLQEIANEKGITKQAVANTLSKIARKYISIYGEIAVPVMEKITK